MVAVPPRSVLAIVLILVPTVLFLLTSILVETLILLLVNYGLGDHFARPLYRFHNWYMNIVLSFYIILVGGRLEWVLGTRIAFTVVDQAGQGHMQPCLTKEGGYPDLAKLLRAPAPGKSKIIMMNHHTRIDWVYLFVFLAYTSLTRSVRVVLKRDLQDIPLLGWGMQGFGFMFLSRNWATDEAYLQSMIDYNKESNNPITVFIFPEGTDLSPSNIEKSQAFARKTGLPELHHVLNPRTTGLVAIKNMLGAENVEEIIDLTVGYTYFAPGERPAELSLVNGRHPPKLHILTQVFRLDTAPESSMSSASVAPSADEELIKWVHDRFAEKEQLLSRFARTNPVGFDAADVKAVLGQDYGVVTYDEDVDMLQHPGSTKLSSYYRRFGLFGVVVVPMFWWLPTVLAWRTWGTLRFVVYLAAVTACFLLLTKRKGSLQQLVFLERVQEGFVFRALRRIRERREKQKSN